MKVNLGCGKDAKEGYINVDVLGGEGIVKKDLVQFLEDLPDDTIDEVILQDILEHFPHGIREDGKELKYDPISITSLGVMEFAFAKLRPDGTMYVRVPDIIWIMEQTISGEFNWDRMVWAVFGDQESPGGYHHTGWTEYKMNEVLHDIGFVDVNVARNRPNLECWARKPRPEEVPDQDQEEDSTSQTQSSEDRNQQDNQE